MKTCDLAGDISELDSDQLIIFALPQSMKSTARNIPLLFIIKACKWFMLYMPIIKLFYEENGLGDTELLGLHAIYSMIIALLEIPSGYVADIWGRKPAMLLGTFFGFVGFAIYSVSYGFFGFMLANIALGIGHSFISGSDTALLYDSLLDQKQEGKYIRTEGGITALGNIAEALAGATVTLLAFLALRDFYYLQTMLAFGAFIAALFILEPSVHKPLQDKSRKGILRIIQFALIEHVPLRRYIVFSSIIGFASLTLAWFAQIIFYNIHLPKAYYGITLMILNLTVAVGSMLAALIDRRMNKTLAIWYILIGLSAGFLFSGIYLSYWALGILVVTYLIRGTAHPILKKYINLHTTTDVRATVLSIRSLIIRLMFSALGPILGIVSEKINTSTALIAAGLTILIPGSIYALLLVRNHHR